ncbi:MAG: hypothetical protein CMA63_06740 [Euryarchaeota archaeon]|nr:hypothetical protein [Euryarchaeota archaeon]|tara:strand:+ start:10673 stop:10984 length:312 start_codon:yes stop_codon:yes gene_type:complete
MDVTDFAATWAPLIISLAVAIETVWSRANNQLEDKIEALQAKLGEVQSWKDRLQGAGLTKRLSMVESRQRKDETSLVSVDHRLQAVDDRLETVIAMLQQPGQS